VRCLPGRRRPAVVIATSIFLDVFNVFLLVLNLFGGDPE
jgi:FtsH-binding integral membrane protein